MTAFGLLIFFLLGPLIARFVWRLSFYALDEVPDPTETAPQNIAQVLSALLADLPVSYLILGPAYLTVGVVMVLYARRRGRPPAWLAACPVAIFFGGILMHDLVIPPPPDVTPKLLILPAFAGVVAAIVCGLIVRRLWQVRKRADA